MQETTKVDLLAALDSNARKLGETLKLFSDRVDLYRSHGHDTTESGQVI